MTYELNKLLKKAYKRYQNHDKPPIPLEIIKEYLEYEGIRVDEDSDSLN